jgi:hypothetical protein
MIQDQVERIIAPQEGEESTHDDGISPVMPFPTSYVLTRDQEDELISHAMTRLEQLERETGRDVCEGEWWGKDAQGVDWYDSEGVGEPQETWMGKRHLYDLTYKNEVGWRSRLLGGIFAQSNLVVPAARRICRQMIARAVNYFFGTDPWFAIYPVGMLDRDRADKADRYIRWKMDQAKLKRTEEQGIERAFIVGEAVVKTSWANRAQIYKARAAVLVDEMGADILAADGDYILEDDPWIMEAAEDPATGEMIPSGQIVLKRDGATPQPPAMNFVEKLITRRITHYKGPEAKVIHFMDFLCPLEAESIQQADCVVHLYDKPLMELADEWKKGIDASESAEVKAEGIRKAVEMLRTLATSSSQPKSAQNSDNVDKSTGDTRIEAQTQPVVEIAEFHLRYDCDGDGILEDVMLVIDRKSRTPIFYDYEANITADGLRPFSVIRVNEVPGRWYGIGAMEMFDTSQKIVDLLVNRWNYSNGKSARVDFWNPHNTIEGRANPNLELNWGGTYTPAPGKSAKDCLESIYLENNTGDQVQELSEFFMQLMTNESGVANSNDGQLAGLESTKLATGIRNIEKSGQELFSLHLGHLEPGVSETLTKMVKLMMSRMDQLEVHRYFEEGEGGEGTGDFQEINPGDISNMELDTRILLTRYRGEQILESSIRAWEIVEKYYAQTSLDVQARTQNMAIDILKALQIPNADRVIEPLPLLTQQTTPVDATGTAQAVAPKPRQGAPNL